MLKDDDGAWAARLAKAEIIEIKPSPFWFDAFGQVFIPSVRDDISRFCDGIRQSCARALRRVRPWRDVKVQMWWVPGASLWTGFTIRSAGRRHG